MVDGGASSNDAQSALFIRLAFVPTPALVSGIARLVSDFCKTGLSDLDVTTRFYMAAHELTENIAKYSTTSRASLEIELSEHA